MRPVFILFLLVLTIGGAAAAPVQAEDGNLPEKSEARVALVASGKAHLAAQEFDAAIEDFTKATDPAMQVQLTCNILGNVFLFRGEAYLRSRIFRDANDDLKRAIICEPQNPVAQFELGHSYFGLRDAGHAIPAYDEAIKLKPDYVDAFKERGKNYENLLQTDKALADYAEVLHLNPGEAETYNNRATIYESLGRLDDAIEDFTRSIEMGPETSMKFFNRSGVYFAQGNYLKSREDLERAKVLFETEKSDPDLVKRLGQVEIKRRDFYLEQMSENLKNAPR